MTTRTQQNPARIASIVVGALLALGGLGLGAAGGLVLGVFGSDGTAASGSHSLSTSSTALVSSAEDVGSISGIADVIGDPRIRLTATATQPTGDLFVGIGPASKVDRYLASAPIEEVTDFEVDPFKLTRKAHPGTARPKPPTSQRFWVARSTGHRTASLQWKVRSGDYRLVLMNADGSRGVRTEGHVALTVPHVARVAWVLLGAGGVMLLGGVGAIVLGARRRKPVP
jgi:hypothetical protein